MKDSIAAQAEIEFNGERQLRKQKSCKPPTYGADIAEFSVFQSDLVYGTMS